MSDGESQKASVEGIVAARTCDCCGHHEIGVVTREGEYIQLKPGMKITVVIEK